MRLPFAGWIWKAVRKDILSGSELSLISEAGKMNFVLTHIQHGTETSNV
jgi:hypothetical protein